MGKLNASKLLKTVKSSMVKHSPEILVGIGIAGMVTTGVMAVKATPKALQLIEQEKERKNKELMEEAKEKEKKECRQISKMKPVDVVKIAWKPYIPTAVTGALSIACLIGASSVSAKRNAALAAAYSLSGTALTEYREKVIETVGEKKEQIIRDKVAKEKLEKDPIGCSEVFVTGKGEALCYDSASGRYFKSDIDRIKKAENELNRNLISEMYISLNEFYEELGLRPVELGDMLGWNVDDGLIDICFSSQLAEDGTPCLVIQYTVAPRYDYGNLH